VRLPNGANRTAAGTEALTDLLIFRRREPGTGSASTLWETVTARNIEGQITRANSYFDEYPERILGELHVGRGMNGGGNPVGNRRGHDRRTRPAGTGFGLHCG
jgi:hypothetical protein